MFSETSRSFRLVLGTEFVPSRKAQSAAYRSSNADKFPKTPLVLPLQREGTDYFTVSTTISQKGLRLGRHLFIPSGIKAGEVLVIEWVEGKSACAIRKSDLLAQQAATTTQPPNCV